MDTSQRNSPVWHRKLNTVFIAFAFIIVGILWLGRNMGWINPELFHCIVSWKMLLVVIGITLLIKRSFVGGVVLITLGMWFMISDSIDFHSFWPVWLILIGLGILFKLQKKGGSSFLGRHHGAGAFNPSGEESAGGAYKNDNSFISSDVTFSSAKHIMLEPVFRGADLDLTFGSLILDLRRTQLEVPQTIIQIDCTFGSVELYVPPTWNVAIEAGTIMGNLNDKRYLAQEIDNEHVLVIRGDITFGNVDIKS